MNEIKTTIRDVTPEDTEALISLCQAIGLFEPDELEELNSMLSAYFEESPTGDRQWLINEEDGKLISVAYYAEETFANGVFNLLLIGVRPDLQQQGQGTKLLHYIEQELKNRGGRILIIETSGLASFEATRAFYQKNGYDREACIREYYNPGEDKIIFRKALNA